MSLRASLVNQGDITVIALEGNLDFENQDILRESIVNLTRQGKRVVVDMEGLNFVGSSGTRSSHYRGGALPCLSPAAHKESG